MSPRYSTVLDELIEVLAYLEEAVLYRRQTGQGGNQMNEREFVAWADQKRAPFEMALAKSVSITVAKHSKRITKFVGWWLTVVGTAAGVLAANSSQAIVLLGARGFKVDFSIIVFGGIMGLWSQYRGTQAQKALSITTSIAKNLPPILDDYKKVEKELAGAEGCPRRPPAFSSGRV